MNIRFDVGLLLWRPLVQGVQCYWYYVGVE